MKQKDFEIFIPISKSIKSEGEHGRFIRGWASVPKEDRDGDLILPTDLSINPFMNQGYINYEHKKGGIYKLGVPTDKTYIDLQRGLFIEAKLFDDSPYADKMWNLAEKVNSGELDVDDDNMLGFSIEAHYSHRDYDDPRILRNVIVTNVALTTHPSNTSASWSTFVKSFTTGSDIVGEGDTGGAAFRKQSFARDLRQLSYTIKSFSSEDWADICNILDDEGRYDHTVAKAMGLMYEINKSGDEDDEDSTDTFKSYMSNMFGEPVDNERNTEVPEEINKSNESTEENNVLTPESESTDIESQVASETASEVSSESVSETSESATSESEAVPDSEAQSEASSETATQSESITESESESVGSETTSEAESESVSSESEAVSESEAPESEASDESQVSSETSTTEDVAPETEVQSETETEASETQDEETLDSDVEKLTSKIDQLEKIIQGLKEDVDKQKIELPDVTEVNSDNNQEEAPSRREPVKTDGSDVANRPPINPDVSSEEETEGSDNEESPEESKVKVEGFLEKIENNLPEIRYRLLPSEFIEFNNALRHLRSGSATAEDGKILQETLKTVGVRSQVQ